MTLHKLSMNGILAGDMELGKTGFGVRSTIQNIALFAHLEGNLGI